MDAADVAKSGDFPTADNYAAQGKVGTANGNMSYTAPSGYHDDCVIALALANSTGWQFNCAGSIRVLPYVPKVGRLWGSGRAMVG